MAYQRAGDSTAYKVLGILAFLLLLTFLCFYLFGAWKGPVHTKHPQSNHLRGPTTVRFG
jgi:hypothetical protein